MAEQPKDILTSHINNNVSPLALPNAMAVLVLGILSLVFCIFYGILGVIIGSIGLYLASIDKKLLDINPNAYTPQSVSNMKAGKTCAFIGIILGTLFIIGIIIVVFSALFFGA